MQRKVRLVTVLLVVLLFAAFSAQADDSDSFTIKVQAQGIVYVSPTKAQMWVGAKTDGDTAEEALTMSNEVMAEIIAIVGKYTEPDLVRTSEFNMYQKERWDDLTGQSVPEGFTLRHVFEVQILDLKKVAPFLDEVTQAGANIIYGLQYGVQDNRTPREEAYKRALEEAWWKARLIAEANGARDLILEDVEEGYYYASSYEIEGISMTGGQLDSYMPGQLQISASLQATFKAELDD